VTHIKFALLYTGLNFGDIAMSIIINLIDLILTENRKTLLCREFPLTKTRARNSATRHRGGGESDGGEEGSEKERRDT
jgi:hypothetical protein